MCSSSNYLLCFAIPIHETQLPTESEAPFWYLLDTFFLFDFLKWACSPQLAAQLTKMSNPNERKDGKQYRKVRIDDLLNPSPEAGSFSLGRGRGRGSASGSGGGNAGRGTGRSAGASGSSSRTHKCSYCNASFATRQELTEHRMQSHQQSFICSQCNSSFFDRGNLNKHVRFSVAFLTKNTDLKTY